MPRALDDDRRKSVVELAQAAAGLAHAQRLAFVQSRSSDPEMVQEALALAESLDKPQDTPRWIGSQIGHFVLTERLGSGGMGEVFAARDLELRRVVAIKFLNPEWSSLPRAEEKFVREAKTASALNHPNIVTIHEVIRFDSSLAIVMERVEGVPLRRLCSQPLPITQILSIGEQIAHALAAAHAAGIAHRDIKPENVMLRPDGHVKVLDFGLAKWSGQDGHTNQSMNSVLPGGTWRYMSPEHYKCAPLTSASDVFALGLVLFELSTGGHPFPADSPLEALHAIANKDAPRPSTRNVLIPHELDSLILGMLAKDPARRPAAGEVAAALKDAELLRSVTTAGSRVRPNSKRRLAAAVLLVGVTAALIWGFRHSPGDTLEFKQVTTLVPENRATAAAISPDGALLAYANVDGIFLRVIKSGETNPLNGPRDFIVDQIAWLPDGAKMIASGFSEETNQPAIWSVSITGGKARELREDARFGVSSPDGSRLAFLSRDYSSIWTMALNGEEPRLILRSPHEDTFLSVLWSSEGHFLEIQRRHYSGNLDNGFVMLDRFYQRSFESVNAETGKIVATLPNLWVQSAAFLPNGRLLMLRMAAPGAATSNETEFWETAVDPVSGKFLGSLQKSAMRAKDGKGRVVSVSTTADGASVTILREVEQTAVFVADFNPVALRFSNARRLTLDERSNYPHAWTADSGSVIFESNRNGNWDLFRQRVNERVPDVLVATPARSEVLPQLSVDGKYVLYASGPTTGNIRPFTLMRVPLEGGPAQHVETNGPLDEFRCSVRRNGRCVVRTTVNRDYFTYSELDPVRGIGRELARTRWQESLLLDWDVSPDGSLLAVPNHDSRSARVRIVRLGTQPDVPPERELNLPGLANISGLVWAADGGGWFISLFTSVGKRILYCDLEGRVHSIGDINGWVVPSPDGKRVAYLHTMLETNAWIAKRR